MAQDLKVKVRLHPDPKDLAGPEVMAQGLRVLPEDSVQEGLRVPEER
jgi:hypothetical protein